MSAYNSEKDLANMYVTSNASLSTSAEIATESQEKKDGEFARQFLEEEAVARCLEMEAEFERRLKERMILKDEAVARCLEERMFLEKEAKRRLKERMILEDEAVARRLEERMFLEDEAEEATARRLAQVKMDAEYRRRLKERMILEDEAVARHLEKIMLLEDEAEEATARRLAQVKMDAVKKAASKQWDTESERQFIDKSVSCVKRIEASLEKDEEKKKEATPVVKLKKKVILLPLPAMRPAVDPFVPADEGLRKWIWNDVLYVRDADNYVWMYDMDTYEMGRFQGKYNYKLDKMEECDEPEFDD